MNSEYPFVSLESGDLRLTVSVPDEKTGFYRGVRFDRAGVFARIEYGGVVFLDSGMTGMIRIGMIA